MQEETKTSHPIQLRERLFLECRAMAEHGLSMGRFVPPLAIEVIDFFERENMPEKINESRDQNGSNGKKQYGIAQLVKVHADLSKIVEPAVPQSILLLYLAKQSGRWRSLGPVPLVRHLMLVAIIALVTFIIVVLSPDINAEGKSIFNSEGIPLLINMLFLLAAAGLGSSFTALYKANRYITKLTFDPNQEASYWIRFLLGLISGLILAIVISENAVKSEFLETGIVRPLLAILGGFSADLVYTFLNRMVETIRSLFEGSSKAIVDTEIEKEKVNLAGKTMKTKLKLARSLIQIREGIETNTNPKEVKSRLDDLVSEIMPEGDMASPHNKTS